MKRREWFKLDNSAKIFPSMTNSLNTNVFRLSVELNEEVKPEILEVCLKDALEEFPMFLCEMKSGLFWHYLEKSNKTPHVEAEKNFPGAKMNNKFLFRLSYYKKRINLEVYHVLADGNGAIDFLKYIVADYLNRLHNVDKKVLINDTSREEKSMDAFKKFDTSILKFKVGDNKKAYKFKLPKRDSIVPGIIEIHMSAKEIKKLAKSYNTTVTIYLVATLIDSIIKCAKVKDLKRPIGITVPVDLRKIYGVKTNRNFFYTICIQYKYKEDYTIEDIIETVSSKLDSATKKKNMQELLNSYMFLEHFFLVRIIPVIIKDLVLRMNKGLYNKHETMTLSNMGVIDMPEQYKDYIESFQGVMSSNDLHLTIMTYKDDIVLSFSNHMISNEIQHCMVKTFKKNGISEIKIVSNEED